ncbi:hypothetical protein BO94DRAFT_545009 [Aspergillus sclerotioniger CBS 115572]|uniref:Zn(2)-C6 fungal-type domain-containing protein n=1 Tax=Aspergillus sclerotioniger CBS 115572 TaxID=1450535 RepID=A0A317WZ44_9EURO|nr:hypothetical protein BO94DRAFT_545009 [Aspergillus sclerotioniger CBS 115572]PWY91649.1 hypothetical protein BO94DRAFT_545009 [Aspergillus sclerotioniger CBS 115572]
MQIQYEADANTTHDQANYTLKNEEKAKYEIANRLSYLSLHRARRIKCDESPGACNNCTSTGRACGYDVHRPVSKVGTGVSVRAALTTNPQWIMTSDERRCLSFFHHQSLPHLVGFFDSPLWQKLILRLSSTEPAVYHALVALGAVSQANDIRGRLPRPGQKKDLRNIWYRFALEQSGRSIALITKRRMSQDPQLQEVILVCCLLFTVTELRCGNFDRAAVHLQGGIRILETMNIQRLPSGLELMSGAVDECVVESFLSLQAGSMYYFAVTPLRCDSDFIYTYPYENYLGLFRSIQHARQIWSPLEHTVFEFIAMCMRTSHAELQANHTTVHHQQLRLLSYMTRFLQQFDMFCLATYGTTSFSLEERNQANNKEQREAELIRIICLSGLLGVKIALYSPAHPPSNGHVHERLALLATVENAMNKFDADPPTFTENSIIAPALYIAACGSPDYFIHCQATDLLRRWGSLEGFLSATVNADLLDEVIKELLVQMYQTAAPLPPGVAFGMGPAGRVTARLTYRAGGGWRERFVALEKNEDLVSDILALGGVEDWPAVQASQLLNLNTGEQTTFDTSNPTKIRHMLGLPFYVHLPIREKNPIHSD